MRFAVIAAALLAAAATPAAAQGSLNLYCSATIEWCTPIARGFERESGIRVVLSQKSTGEMLAQLRAEARSPPGAMAPDAGAHASREARKLQTMANRGVPLTDGAPNMATARIIDDDNARFGASAERRRLLARWDREVGALPR